MRRAVLVIITVLMALGVQSARAVPARWDQPPRGACEILIQFFNTGTPGMPGASPDSRYGVRLNVEGAYAVVPSDDAGFVRLFGTEGQTIRFTAIPLYLSMAYEPSPSRGMFLGDQTAGCGFNPIQVPAGT